MRRGDQILTDQSSIQDAFHAAFNSLLGKASARAHTLDLQYLGMSQLDLSELRGRSSRRRRCGRPSKTHPLDRAPGTDDFFGLFYHKAWLVIKHDIMVAFLKMFVEDGRGFGKLNKAHVVLIPKTPEALEVRDFRPISLPHSFSKLFAKVLAIRPRKSMHDIVNTNQSTFIKGHSIHKNYLLVRQVARKIHASKVPGTFLKLDISRDFDSLS